MRINDIYESYSNISVSNSKTEETQENSLFDKDSTRNGKIDDIKQGTGDCYLLSSLLAISYSNAGKEQIESMLEYSDDGITVHTQGGFGDIHITNEEIEEAKKGKYAKGDDDVIAFELAMSNIYQDVVNLDTTVWYNKEVGRFEKNSDENIIDGGNEQVYNYFLGKEADYIYKSNPDAINETLDKLAQDKNENLAAVAGTPAVFNYNPKLEKIRVEDVNGDRVDIYHQHAYAVKSVDDKNVTVVNPWDSSEEITLSRENFLSVFDNVMIADVSDDSATYDYEYESLHSEAVTINDEGKYVNKYNLSKDEQGNVLAKNFYDKQGNKILTEQYDKQGNVLNAFEYYENGNLKSSFKTTQVESGNGEKQKISTTKSYNKNNKETEREIRKYYEGSEVVESVENIYYKKGKTKTNFPEDRKPGVYLSKFDYYDGEMIITKRKYDKEGNLTEKKSKEYSAKYKNSRDILNEKYDENGNMIYSKSKIYNDYNGNVVSIKKEYDYESENSYVEHVTTLKEDKNGNKLLEKEEAKTYVDGIIDSETVSAN